jgi:hypothetical protein
MREHTDFSGMRWAVVAMPEAGARAAHSPLWHPGRARGNMAVAEAMLRACKKFLEPPPGSVSGLCLDWGPGEKVGYGGNRNPPRNQEIKDDSDSPNVSGTPIYSFAMCRSVRT